MKSQPRIAIMQGRLVPPEAGRFQSFPRRQWPMEFAKASAAQLDAIEWIYDEFGEDVNPLGSDEGIERFRAPSKEHGVSVASVCADYFMDRPLVRTSAPERAERVRKLEWLLGQCKRAEIERIVIPFVDQSRLANEDDMNDAVDILNSVIPSAEANSVELHLETSLAPAPFSKLLGRLPSASIKVTYDSGNSASLGYDPKAEFAAYGDRIGSVHIKDRIRGGGTVPLGTGDADLPTVINELGRIGYCGDYVLQVARSEPGDELIWAKQNRQYLQSLLGTSTQVAEM